MPHFRRRFDASESAVLGREGEDPDGKSLQSEGASTELRPDSGEKLRLVVLNTKSTPTFRCSGFEGHTADVIFALESHWRNLGAGASFRKLLGK